MSAVMRDTTRPGAKPAGQPGRAGWTAVAALTRVESARLLRHPVLLVAVALTCGGGFAGTPLLGEPDPYPVLHHVDTATQPLLIVAVAGALMLAANLATLRAHRHGTEPLYGVLVLAPWQRTTAQLAALLPAGVLALLIAVVYVAAAALRPGAVGQPNPVEVATGPVLVLLAGAAGVLVARLVRSVLAVPLILIGCFATAAVFFFSPGGQVSPLRWLRPVVRIETATPVVPELLGRPAGWHLLYLAGLTAVVAVLAMLRAGAPRRAAGALLTVALAATTLGGLAQLSAPSAEVERQREVALTTPSRLQRCQAQGDITYCWFEPFGERVRQWDSVVRKVVARVPAGVELPQLTVRQRPEWGSLLAERADAADRSNRIAADWARDDAAAGTPGSIPVSTSWQDDDAGLLALAVAGRLVGGPSTADPALPAYCGGRAVVMLALAAPEYGFAPGLEPPPAGVPAATTVLIPSGPAGAQEIEQRAAQLAAAIATWPADRLGAALREHWAALADPATTTDQAARLLGLPAPAAAPAGTPAGACG